MVWAPVAGREYFLIFNRSPRDRRLSFAGELDANSIVSFSDHGNFDDLASSDTSSCANRGGPELREFEWLRCAAPAARQLVLGRGQCEHRGFL